MGRAGEGACDGQGVPFDGVRGLRLAVRRDALRLNPVRDVGNFERGERRAARALTVDEAREWLALLDSDAYAVRKDIPDTTGSCLGLVSGSVRRWMSAGVTWTSTAVWCTSAPRWCGPGRESGEDGRPGTGVLQLPPWLEEVLAQRRGGSDGDAPVFADAAGGYRDRNNVERDVRQVRTGHAVCVGGPAYVPEDSGDVPRQWRAERSGGG